jgi:hypothetical protein
MTAKKTKVTSSVKPAKARASGSSPKKATTPDSARGTPSPAPDHLVRLHDLGGVTLMYLPGKLRLVVGEAAYQRCRDELMRMEITLILRTDSDIVYVDLPLVIKDLPPDYAALADLAIEHRDSLNAARSTGPRDA